MTNLKGIFAPVRVIVRSFGGESRADCVIQYLCHAPIMYRGWLLSLIQGVSMKRTSYILSAL